MRTKVSTLPLMSVHTSSMINLNNDWFHSLSNCTMIASMRKSYKDNAIVLIKGGNLSVNCRLIPGDW